MSRTAYNRPFAYKNAGSRVSKTDPFGSLKLETVRYFGTLLCIAALSATSLADTLPAEEIVSQQSSATGDAEATTSSGGGSSRAGESSANTVTQQTTPKPHFKKSHPVKVTTTGKPDNSPKPWSQWQQMTGDWGGTRTDWVNEGILWELVYTGEVMSRISGGDKSEDDTSGLGNADLTLTLDTGSLDWWKGGTFFVYLQSLVGDGNAINDAVGGPLAPISTLDADD
ncbi:MAG: hypothetical protein AAF420_16555, partial [Pseudomonadota bacterium]